MTDDRQTNGRKLAFLEFLSEPKVPPPKKNSQIWSPDSGHLRAAAVGDTVRATPPTPVSSPVGLRRVQRGPGPDRGRVGVGQQLWVWVLVPQ